jgi:hypothetical protein
MAQIQHNMEEEAKRIDRVAEKMTEGLRRGMIRALQTVGRTSAQDWLQGPRPERLGIASGALIRAMQGIHSFTIGEGDSPSFSSKNGWVKSWKAGNMVHGEIGVSVISSEGKDYPQYWETDGSDHDGPRPFLNPAGNQALSAGLLDRDIQAELNKVKLD